MKKNFVGIMPAIFSVYDENMNVIKPTVRKMVDYQLKNGCTGFYVGGNTGECTVLPAKTRKQMLEAVIEANEGRGTVMAHIGAGHFDETMDLLEHANSLEGVDAVASLPPSLTGYYKMPNTVDYYRTLAEKSKTPVFAYITGVLNGSPLDFANQVASIPNIAGIKLTIPDYFTFGRVCAAHPEMNILNGPDETMVCGLSMGADGAIGTTYNFVPRLAVGIYEAFLAGKMDEAREKQQKLQSIIGAALGNGISYWKAIMTIMGYDMGATVFPGKNPTAAEVAELEAKLKALGFFDVL